MESRLYIKELYQAVDKFDSAAIADKMTENGKFRFANMPAVEGHEAFCEFLDGFSKTIKGMRHDQLESWECGDVFIVNGFVSYTRHDDSVLTVPFSTTLKIKQGLIYEYRVFVDNSDLFQTT